MDEATPRPARDARRARERDESARVAAVRATAARWLVLSAPDDPTVVPVDVVAALLALHPRTTLRSRDGDRLRALAGQVAGLVALGAACPSGRPLLEVLVADPAERERVVPALDPMALLLDDGPTSTVMDRTIRLAGAMVERAAAHRAGEVDLVAAVDPPLPRHRHADELDAVVAVATADVGLPATSAPAVTELPEGWLSASPYELFVAAGKGLLAGVAADVGGAALARWFEGWVAGRDPWRQPLLDRVPVDADGLLRDAAARAGSDHPAVLAGPLVDLVAARHPGGAP